MKALIIAAAIALGGCASTKAPVPATTITYSVDRFGVPAPVVNGVRYEMTEDERRSVIQAIVNEYCPAS